MKNIISLLKTLIFEQYGMGLGITRASLVSAVCDDTGDDSIDAVVKVRRLINRRGAQFCNLAPFPFLRTQINFTISNAGGYSYSGSGYLPATFKRIISAYLLDGNNKRLPLTEVGVIERDNQENPNENTDTPTSFCISRMDTNKTYYVIELDCVPDQTYTFYAEIETQWSDLTADDSETLITKQYYDAFSHFCTMARLKQQGDTEQYAIYQNEWDGGNSLAVAPRSILGTILSGLSSALRKKSVVPLESKKFAWRDDYRKSE